MQQDLFKHDHHHMKVSSNEQWHYSVRVKRSFSAQEVQADPETQPGLLNVPKKKKYL